MQLDRLDLVVVSGARMPALRGARIALLLLASMGSAACCKDKLNLAADASPSSPTTASSAAAAADLPVVRIPAGQLIAGSPCQSIPRITTEELEGTGLQMGAFDIDAYPFPNDPAQPPMVNVSRDEAVALCSARGRRLCTELEWERACKGPSNTMYEYGKTYSPSFCAGPGNVLRAAGTYDKCQSAFGVKAMHGVVWEWTASDWGRGTTGGLVTVRGGYGPHRDLQTRCANGQSRAPTEKTVDIGFRCCGGTPNTASVQLVPRLLPVIVPEGTVDPGLASKLMQALPQNMRDVAGHTVSFDKVWRWHPRGNEELVVGRWAGQKAGSQPFYVPVVFHLCGGTTTMLARARGPVERMEDPGGGATAEEIAIAVQTATDKGDVRFTYHYGAVNMTQPAWIKSATTLEPDAGAPLSTPPRLKLPIKK
ncbi:MAG: SUMF1/EgtB/PvdO family nonheme iron enzyme [Deltaproteobacteria bacterium]|nr:SUMF1/EgtB/PvdO family nonheme iron enzyme [Deltaproteobacteria bacterium]